MHRELLRVVSNVEKVPPRIPCSAKRQVHRDKGAFLPLASLFKKLYGFFSALTSMKKHPNYAPTIQIQPVMVVFYSNPALSPK
jgi:hypothetical protein